MPNIDVKLTDNSDIFHFYDNTNPEAATTATYIYDADSDAFIIGGDNAEGTWQREYYGESPVKFNHPVTLGEKSLMSAKVLYDHSVTEEIVETEAAGTVGTAETEAAGTVVRYVHEFTARREYIPASGTWNLRAPGIYRLPNGFSGTINIWTDIVDDDLIVIEGTGTQYNCYINIL